MKKNLLKYCLLFAGIVASKNVSSEAVMVGLLKPDFKNSSQFYRDIESLLVKAMNKVNEAKKDLQDKAVVLSQKAELEFKELGVVGNPEGNPQAQAVISKYKKLLRDKEDAVELANQELAAAQTDLSEKFEAQVRKASQIVCEEAKVAYVMQYDKTNPFVIAANPKLTVDLTDKIAKKLDELAEKDSSVLMLKDSKKMLLADNDKKTETLVAKASDKNSDASSTVTA